MGSKIPGHLIPCPVFLRTCWRRNKLNHPCMDMGKHSWGVPTKERKIRLFCRQWRIEITFRVKSSDLQSELLSSPTLSFVAPLTPSIASMGLEHPRWASHGPVTRPRSLFQGRCQQKTVSGNDIDFPNMYQEEKQIDLHFRWHVWLPNNILYDPTCVQNVEKANVLGYINTRPPPKKNIWETVQARAINALPRSSAIVSRATLRPQRSK